MSRPLSGLFCVLLALEALRASCGQAAGLALGGELVPRGPEFIVTSETNYDQKQPWLAAADSGRFVVSYSRGDVYARILDPDGNPLGADFLVNPTINYGEQDETYVSVDPLTGDFVVVWSDRHGNDGHNMGIGGRFFAADGTPRGPEMILNVHTAESQFEPHAAFSASGQVLVAWTDAGIDGSAGVVGRVFDRHGNALTGEILINEPNTFTQIDPSVAADRYGNFVVAYVDASGATGEPREVLVRRFGPYGTAQGSAVLVNSSSAGMQRDPFVAMNNSGEFVVAFQDESGTDGSGYGIFARLFDNQGNPLGPQFLVPDATAGDQSDPHVAMDFVGNFIISWVDAGGGDAEVMARRYDRSGSPLGAAFTVHQAGLPGDQNYPKFAVSQSGQRFIAVYYDSSDDYARVYDLPMIVPSAAPVVGQTIALDLDLPGSGTDKYWLVGSFATTPGIPARGFRTLPLNFDALFQHCIFNPGGPVFFGLTGVLDGAGFASASFVVPNDPVVAGITFHMAAWTYRGAAATQMEQITDAITLTIGN